MSAKALIISQLETRKKSKKNWNSKNIAKNVKNIQCTRK